MTAPTPTPNEESLDLHHRQEEAQARHRGRLPRGEPGLHRRDPAEPGNKWYEHYRSVDDPDTILTIEAFDDAAAGEAHVSSEHFQQGIDGDAKQYISERPYILYIDAADRDGWDKMSEF